jgi:RNA polymerase sigma-70 factor (ECF subfamily)
MIEQVSDATLLERFITRHEEAAFAALVQRHGPLVLGVCRRVLRNPHDAEDVFQATFLVLARKAVSIPWQTSVGKWLCVVAQRLALNVRAGTLRRQARERSLALHGGDQLLAEEHHPQADPLAEIARRELRRVLDDELHHLPEKYRAPLVLCYLEGKTNEEAARELGWPTGSMSRRLERARALLRLRLIRRGLCLGTALLGLLIAFLCLWGLPRIGPHAEPVRQAMLPFRPTGQGGQGFEDALARLARDEAPLPRREEVGLLARQTARAAEQIGGHDPGRNRQAWRAYAEEMRQAALQLALAAQENDGPGVRTAARRLNANCQQCHDVFRQ